MNLQAIREKSPRYVIGLMSGSSCDGIDGVLVRLKGQGAKLAMKLMAHQHHAYAPELHKRLLDAHQDAQAIARLHFALGERLADLAAALVDVGREEGVAVDFIASHGHTLAHIPPPAPQGIGTLQIGETAIIAERTGLPVVADFRPRDMAAGGQGAPLVPYADWLLFHKLKHQTACLNIGGIANFTVLTPALEDVIAFDSGPGNMPIDATVRYITRGLQDYDLDGKLAAKGLVIDEFLEYLLNHPYFDQVPPKSTGREQFGFDVYLQDALTARKEHAPEDLVATVTQAVAQSIIDAFQRFVLPEYPVEHLIIAGGGAANICLLNKLKHGLPDVHTFTMDQYGIPLQAREAIAFAILGNECIMGTPANVPHATGANHPCVLGKITPP